MRVKQDGTVLLPTLIISAMILALALSLTKIVSNELQFASDLLLGERAYFAAESGVEGALLFLKREPINLIEREIPLAKGTSANITTFNAVESFDFELDLNETLRWRLGRDADKGLDFVGDLVKDFRIDGQNVRDNLQWKIQCAENKKTIVIQGRAKKNRIDKNSRGTLDQGGRLDISTIMNFLKERPSQSLCYVSLTNFGSNVITGAVEAKKKLAPAQTKVQAIGLAAGREKIIEFEFRQKNLAPFFDFGLLHNN